MQPASLDELLVRTSRTYALAIPLLDEPMRSQVGLAYLLFRIADTFEDAATWSVASRVQALRTFAGWLDGPRVGIDRQVRNWLEERPSGHAGYLDLLAATPVVLGAVDAVSPAARAAIVRETVRTCEGMERFVARTVGDRLDLTDLEDLQAYCYVVAGIVGELLTELAILDAPELEGAREALESDAATFGEALQLVNILKDCADDDAEGRSYLPKGVSVAEVFDLARSDLRVAARYVRCLETRGASRGYVAFTALPVRLAWAALDRIEAAGPGAKLDRATVLTLHADVVARLAAGAPVIPEQS
jgi:farnesyl-diphosphate farnesyltransferase